MLRVNYTNTERLELGKQLAESHNDLGKVNADFDGVKASFKSKIAAHEAQIVDLSTKVASGYRMENVKCSWVMDMPVQGKKQLLRLDEGEVVEIVDMTEADRQRELELTAALEKTLNPDGSVTVSDEQPVQPTGVAADGVVTTPADK